jgi:asparagine synthase (glutamine-hydrolysing)
LSRDGTAPGPDLSASLASALAVARGDRVTERASGPVLLVHAFLATRAGATPGPHTDSAGRWLAGDVRLDDRHTLSSALARAGIEVPSADDDDALVLAAYRAWGADAVGRLRGDFSFALWDPVAGVLLCARDGLGVRPLFYAELGSALVCANALSVVRAHPLVTRTLHEPAIVSFLHWGFNLDTRRTTFADIRRLEAGHLFTTTATGGAVEPQRHWTFPEPDPLSLRDDREYVDGFRHLLGLAVADRLRVPSAALQLSGGLDSTGIAATVRRVAPDVRLKAFTFTATWQFDDQEGRLAGDVAARLGYPHVIYDDVFVPLEHVDDPAYRTPEPVDEFSVRPQRRLWADAAAHGRVMFIGEDGDALLHPPDLLTTLRNWPAWRVAWWYLRFAATRGRLPYSGFGLRKRLRGQPLRWPGPPVPAWLRADVVARTGLARMPEFPAHRSRPGTREMLLGPLWQHIQEYDAFDYMRQPVEVRWPLLDTRLLEFVLAVPPVPWCQKKELEREAFRDELPAPIIQRPKTTFAGTNDPEIAMWRSATRNRQWPITEHTAQFVDADVFRDTLDRAPGEGVAIAWRVLQLDQWLRTF